MKRPYATTSTEMLQAALKEPSIGEPAKKRVREELARRGGSADKRLGPSVTEGPDMPEEAIRREVVKALRTLGFGVWDTEQGYRRDGSTRVTRGLPDLFVMGHGRVVAVELKSRKGKQTPEQRDFERLWTKNGGVYLLWRSVEEGVEWGQRAMEVAA